MLWSLKKAGISATVKTVLSEIDIKGACGQLKSQFGKLKSEENDFLRKNTQRQDQKEK